ncbi:hypothetical protein Q31a_51380 [Aureliella helgolandensis]|uniref:Uncharacterized protein n=1 Tax=Aureliella helgolandensis TaxID=2527968 RepID=A0A518GDT0_9BACT|nr:hypothetical protein Q31a_51380 [Aureliella helgolandensis]
MLQNPYETPRTERDNRAVDASQQKSPFAGCAAAFFLIAGSIGTLLGSAWIRTFGFTDYRAHLAHIGLPLGILTLVFSIVFIAFGIAIIRKGFRQSSGS